ncbi:50S ribosomal protein L16 [Candidatus Woesearchaeota archaeon]|nr:MAG: 50S ribosomal protein L16 [Candidatus Woesearchaeota archaeon]
MAKKRKFIAYRRIERPYTRKSKYREKSFVRTTPANRIVRYEMGNPTGKFQYKLHLISDTDLQIRDLALESMRLTSNRLLEKTLGRVNYFLKIMVYPHHVLRENPLAAGAGADRMSTGMKHSFGKSIGIAARIKKGQKIMTVAVNKSGLATAKKALIRAKQKLPNSYHIIAEKIA